MSQEKIGIDIDDVLSHHAEGFTEYSNRRWGAHHKAEDYNEDWSVFWGISHEQALLRAEEFHRSGAAGQYRHFEDALPVLTKLTARYDLLAITSRRILLKPETDAWFDRHFPGIFQDIYYAGIYDRQSSHHHKLTQTKAQICRELGVSYLIDDQVKHCLSAAEVGIDALLFGDYSWNRVDTLPENVTRTKDWQAVLQYFDEQSRR